MLLWGTNSKLRVSHIIWLHVALIITILLLVVVASSWYHGYDLLSNIRILVDWLIGVVVATTHFTRVDYSTGCNWTLAGSNLSTILRHLLLLLHLYILHHVLVSLCVDSLLIDQVLIHLYLLLLGDISCIVVSRLLYACLLLLALHLLIVLSRLRHNGLHNESTLPLSIWPWQYLLFRTWLWLLNNYLVLVFYVLLAVRHYATLSCIKGSLNLLLGLLLLYLLLLLLHARLILHLSANVII